MGSCVPCFILSAANEYVAVWVRAEGTCGLFNFDKFKDDLAAALQITFDLIIIDSDSCSNGSVVFPVLLPNKTVDDVEAIWTDLERAGWRLYAMAKRKEDVMQHPISDLKGKYFIATWVHEKCRRGLFSLNEGRGHGARLALH